MSQTVSVPLWVFVVLLALAGWALLSRLLVPSVRWFFRRRVNTVIQELNQRLDIKIQPFKLTKRRVLLDRLIFDPEVMAAAEVYADEESMPREVAMDKVRRYADEIVPAFNAYLYFRIGTWLARRLASLLYRVRLGFSDEEGLKTLRPGSTVVFLMNHRSNMDYVLVAFLAASHSALSYAVGEWARIWPLETLIRSMGAYFVRRKSRNALYRRVLQRYVRMATAHGVTQAVYPEGGLSRDGRLQPAKLGLLGYMLRGFEADGDRDLVFVPVGINYDRILEDRSLLLDLDPDAHRKTAWQALGTTFAFLRKNLWLRISGRGYRFGYACVNFGTPISLRAWATERDIDLEGLERQAFFDTVESLGETLMEAVGRVVPALPTALVATAFVRRPERAWNELALKAEVQSLIEGLEDRGFRVYIPRANRDYAITVGLRMLTLRHLVEEDQGLFRPRPEELTLLTYYANSIAHLAP